MQFLHINPSTNNEDEFDKMVNNGNHVFVLIYMEGCGPCQATRPEWAKIKNILGQPDRKKKYPKVVVADVDQILCDKMEHIKSLSGFPTMRYISGNGNVVENYENDRSIDAFIEWIDSKHGNFVDNSSSRRHSRNGGGGRSRNGGGRRSCNSGGRSRNGGGRRSCNSGGRSRNGGGHRSRKYSRNSHRNLYGGWKRKHKRNSNRKY
jgi:hypothetical protein